MVLRDLTSDEDFFIKINGKWIKVDQELLSWHPGGSAMLAYKNLEATTTFHSFHAGSKQAYRMLEDLVQQQQATQTKNGVGNNVGNDKPSDKAATVVPDAAGTPENTQPKDIAQNRNMIRFEMVPSKSDKICQNFEALRVRVRTTGLLDADHMFYARKFLEAVGLFALAFWLQDKGYIVGSALTIALAWQQCGWLFHDYTHHQHFKTRAYNDFMTYIIGNVFQGYSSRGWKEQHNRHHAAPNVDGRDGDLDLLPFWATVETQLKHVDPDSIFSRMIPFQHLYWIFALPLLRLSWMTQTIAFLAAMSNNFYESQRKEALIEQVAVAIHWILVFTQLYLLPTNSDRIIYFLVSQMFSGFLTAHVVTYNHYSCDKFPYEDRVMENYACLQLYTTRNMAPGPFIDWLWGGLNYQIEHHLFPTMPRHNLKKVMPLVKDFCRENGLPYMVDGYFTGFFLSVEQLKKVALVASEYLRCKTKETMGVSLLNSE